MKHPIILSIMKLNLFPNSNFAIFLIHSPYCFLINLFSFAKKASKILFLIKALSSSEITIIFSSSSNLNVVFISWFNPYFQNFFTKFFS